MKPAFLLLLAILVSVASSQSIYPVAVFHGMGDDCESEGMKQLVQELSDNLSGTYVTCIEFGAGKESFLQSLTKQAEIACEQVQKDENLRGNISVIGFSQGGLMARSVVEQCKFDGQVRRYLGVGSPQLGGASCPKCFKGILCRPVNNWIRKNAYNPEMQEKFGPAQQYYDARNYTRYLEGNTFLPLINNQKEENQLQKEKITGLELMYLTQFAGDTIMNPPSSSWFEQWDSTMKHIVPMKEQEFYKQDSLGLKTLDSKKRIKYLKFPGDHLEFTPQDVKKYFVPALRGLNIPSYKDTTIEEQKSQNNNNNLRKNNFYKFNKFTLL